MSLLPERPDAVLCFNDQLALGALHTLARAGVRVPLCDLDGVGRDVPQLLRGHDDGRYVEAGMLLEGLLQRRLDFRS